MTTEYRRMQQLRGTSTDWSANDIALINGEIGFETGGATLRAKFGDGTSLWSALPYIFETDTVARASAADVAADLASVDSRVTALETTSGDLTDIQSQVDANTAAIAGKQNAFADGTADGGLLYWNGTAYVASENAMSNRGVAYYDTATSDYLSTATPTAYQIMQADVDGKPSWITTVLLPTGSTNALAALGDTDTGLRFPAADTVSVMAGGAERIKTSTTQTEVLVTGASQDSLVRFHKDETGEVILEAFLASAYATKHVLNLNKFGGGVLVNDAVITSAAELKRVISPLDSAVAGLLKIPVVCYDRGPGTRSEIGIMAGDVLSQFLPAATVKDGRASGFYYSDMLAVTIRAVQELSKEITDLRARLPQHS